MDDIMFRPRLFRFLTVLVALFSLLFTQLAVAAYACPDMAPVKAALMLDASGQPMQDCPMADKASPSLCQAHAKGSPQSFDKAEPAAIAPFMPAALITLVAAVDPLHADPGEPRAARLRAVGTSPPILIRHCCFRL
jgi:hypothetical protein